MHRRGLRNTRGGKLTLCGLGNILQNPFYIGLIYVKSTGQTYEGVHEPIVPAATWKRVQDIRQDRSGPKSIRHNHLFQGIFRCGLCGRPMVPEAQKGHVYYRCKAKACPTKTIREETLEDAIVTELRRLELSARAAEMTAEANPPETIASLEEQRAALSLLIADEEKRLDRIEDLLIDGAISEETYDRKRRKIQLRLTELRDQLRRIPDPVQARAHQEQLAELRRSLVLLYENTNRAERRMIVENVWPNRTVSGREPRFEPYDWVVKGEERDPLLCGALERDTGRTLIGLLDMAGNGRKGEMTQPELLQT